MGGEQNLNEPESTRTEMGLRNAPQVEAPPPSKRILESGRSGQGGRPVPHSPEMGKVWPERRAGAGWALGEAAGGRASSGLS